MGSTMRRVVGDMCGGLKGGPVQSAHDAYVISSRLPHQSASQGAFETRQTKPSAEPAAGLPELAAVA